MKKSFSVYIGYAFMVFVILLFAAVLYQDVNKQAPQKKENIPLAPLVYNKGGVSFTYPGDWEMKDIPADTGMISVQVTDPDDFIVVVASSANTFTDIKMKGKPQYQKDIELNGIKGTEQLWQDDKTQTVILRADHLKFQNRFYRFEMFTNRSRQVKADRIWKDVLASVKFATSTQDTIQALPKK